jgi:hypothetical protein
LSGRGVDARDDATYAAQAERLVNAWEALAYRPDAPKAEPPPPTHAERTAAEVATMMATLAEELAAVAQARPGSNAEAIIAGVGSLSITVIQQALLALRGDPACDPHLGYHSADQLVRTLLEHAMPAFLTLQWGGWAIEQAVEA